MMKNYRSLLGLPAALLLAHAGHAQSVGIGTANPNTKAALEIAATDRGLLIPRLTAAQRTAIVSPPQGLMVYQTDGTASGGPQTGFWYYAGTGGWVLVNPTGTADNLGNHTATQNLNLTDKLLVGGTAGAPGTEGLKIASTGRVGIRLGAAAPAYDLDLSAGNLNGRTYYLEGFLGLTKGTLGTNNIFVGTGPIPGINSTGDANTVLGQGAAGNLAGGDRNTAVGVAAGYNFKDSQHNTALGYYAGYSVSSTNATAGDSDDNTFVGYQAAQSADAAIGTTALGANTGLNLRGGDHNTFVGNEADLSSAASQHTNATAIGYQAKVNQDNTLVLGGTGANAVKVGIGTAAPLTRLVISPSVVEPKITLWDGGSTTNHYGFGVSGSQLNYHVGSAGDNHVFWAGGKNGDGTELARLTGAGRLGIGVPSPTATLDVVRGTAPNGTATFRGTDRTSNFSYSTAEDTYIRGGKATANVLLNDDGGRVGIGTGAPFSQLANTAANVVGADGYGVGEKSLTWSSNLAGYAGAFFNANAGAGQNGLAVKVAGANAAATALDVSQGTAGAAGASLLTVRANGYVGIGTASPNATLEVRRGTAGDGTAAFWGTTRTSHFNYSTAEDTYLRGGKATSNVYINDTGGNVGVGTSAAPQRLTVAGTALANNNSNGTAAAVIGNNASTGAYATGVEGTAAGNGYGVQGTAGTNGYGVGGTAAGSSGRGVDGFALDGVGVYGTTDSGTGVYAEAVAGNDGVGLRAKANGANPAAVIIQNGSGLAVDVIGGAVRTKTVQTPATGSNNMLPVAYGSISDVFAFAIANSSGNFTAVKNSTGNYTLTFPQFSTVSMSDAFILVQANQNFFDINDIYYATASTSGPNGQVNIQVRDLARNPINGGFSFLMFKP